MASSSSSSPGDAPPPNDITMILRLTTHPVLDVPANFPLTISSGATILNLKQQLEREWDGNPSPDGIVCVKGGRVCRDGEVLIDVFPPGTRPYDTILHVIVRPSAWKTPFAALASTLITSAASTTPVAVAEPTTSTPSEGLTPATPSFPSAPVTPGYNPSYVNTPLPVPPALNVVPPTSPPATPSLGPTVSGYPTYLAYLSQLIPLQRALLLLNLQKAHYFYAIDVNERYARLGWGESSGSKVDPIVDIVKEEAESEEEWFARVADEKGRLRKEMEEGVGEVREVRDLLSQCGLWGLVKEQEEEAEREVEEWAQRTGSEEEFQVVDVGGSPYLLHIPPSERPSSSIPPLNLYKSLKRGLAIHHILTTLLQLLVTYQPSSPSIAYGRALLRPPTANAPGTNPANLLPHPQPLNPLPIIPPRRRATLSIVINLEAIVAIIFPMFILALKLGFLLWIFGRHASPTKRLVLGGMAAVWILWEGWGMYRRRAAVAAIAAAAAAGGGGIGAALAGRDRNERRRAALVAAGAGPGAPVGVPAAPRAPAPGNNNDDGGLRQRAAPANAAAPGAPPARPAHRVHRAARDPPSRFSPRYWITRIATIGLVDEAHELGLTPRRLAGQPLPPPTPRARPTPARRALRTAMVAFVLFVGTLSPEVERKRRKAIEKRDRVLAERKAAAERAAAEKVVKEAKEKERVEKEQKKEQERLRTDAQEKAGLVEAESIGRGEGTNGSAEGSTSTPSSPPQGRAVISDADLFSDGVGEPDQTVGGSATEGGGTGDEVDGVESDDEVGRDGDGDGEAQVDGVLALF